jgi:hypothetical protein
MTQMIHDKGGIGSKMAGGNPHPARGREKDDFYATPHAVTEALVLEYRHRFHNAYIFEPCAGDGAMAESIIKTADKCYTPVAGVYATDIAPRSEAVHQKNVFDITRDTLAAAKVSIVVTNPPFNIAPEIIQHFGTVAGVDAPVNERYPMMFALVLKATFWQAARRAVLFRRWPPLVIHPLLWRPDFKSLGAPTMDIMWCVWDSVRFGAPTAYVPFRRP